MLVCAFSWEQRKLNEYLTVSTKKNTEDKYDKTDVLSVSGEVGVVNQIEFQGRSFAGASVSNYGVVETGDVVYTKSPLRANPYGIIKANKGKSGIVSTLYAVYKTIQGTANADFIECYFDLDDRLNMYLKPLVNIGAKHDMKVTDENALKGGVLFPSYEEQCQIADFFSRLDTLITLHQRECFSFDFSGESAKTAQKTISWEQRKLGEVATLTSSKRVHASDYVDNGIPFFRGSEISKLGGNTKLEDVLYISEDLYEQLKRNYGVPKENDILITAVGTLGNTFVIKGNTPFYFKDGNLIWLKDIHINSDYLGVYIGDGIGKQRVLNSAAGSNQKALTMVKLNDVAIDCPSEAEQKKISMFFRSLDNLITLHQHKPNKKGHDVLSVMPFKGNQRKPHYLCT